LPSFTSNHWLTFTNKSSLYFYLFVSQFGLVKKRVSLGIRIDETLARQLESVASETGIKPATLARLAIEDYLRQARQRGRLAIPLSQPANMVIGNTGTVSQSIVHQSSARKKPRPHEQ
jgi:hypothetical protein